MARSVWAELKYNEPLSQFVGVENYDKPAEEYGKVRDKIGKASDIIKAKPALDADLEKEKERLNYYDTKLNEIHGTTFSNPVYGHRAVEDLAKEVQRDETIGARAYNQRAISERTKGVEELAKSNMTGEDVNTAVNWADGIYNRTNPDNTKGHYTDPLSGRHNSYLSKTGIETFKHDNELVEKLETSLGTTVGQHGEENDRVFLSKLKNAGLEDVVGVMTHKKSKESNLENLNYAAERLLSNRDVNQAIDARAKLLTIKEFQKHSGLDARALAEQGIDNTELFNEIYNQNKVKISTNIRNNFIGSFANTKAKEDKSFQTLFNPFTEGAGNSKINENGDFELRNNPQHKALVQSPFEGKSLNDIVDPDKYNQLKSEIKKEEGAKLIAEIRAKGGGGMSGYGPELEKRVAARLDKEHPELKVKTAVKNQYKALGYTKEIPEDQQLQIVNDFYRTLRTENELVPVTGLEKGLQTHFKIDAGGTVKTFNPESGEYSADVSYNSLIKDMKPEERNEFNKKFNNARVGIVLTPTANSKSPIYISRTTEDGEHILQSPDNKMNEYVGNVGKLYKLSMQPGINSRTKTGLPITITSPNGETLKGNFKVKYKEGQPIIQYEEDGKYVDTDLSFNDLTQGALMTYQNNINNVTFTGIKRSQKEILEDVANLTQD